MAKERFTQLQLLSDSGLIKRTVKEELEISSTGYGYESVSIEKENHEYQSDQQLDSFSEGY